MHMLHSLNAHPLRRKLGLRRWIAGWLSVCCLIAALKPGVAFAQGGQPAPIPYYDEALSIIAGMSPEQRVGQLFIVSFPGDDASPTSDIARLINEYHIGGVQLRAANRNFDNARAEPPVTVQIAQLTNALQTLALANPTSVAPSATADAAQSGTSLATSTPAVQSSGTAIPLFIAMSREADWAARSELSEIAQEITPIPSQLAIGATWDPANAQIAGEIIGSELSQLGINVLFGPSLDVMDTPRPNSPGDLGTYVFGGDPFWVGKLGAAFVAGVHSGSKNRMAVVARNFPGLGSSDRNVGEEIPTVQKSLEQLRLIELAPFFAVLKGAASQETTVDGLLVSHIRYRGFQGNIRASTRPVSFDPQAYQALMSMPETAAWRSTGGVTFSDALGARSVRRFYDPSETTFNARRIAQEAFVAGNDVLVLGNFGLTDAWPEQLDNIINTIQFFQTKYVEDKSFAARVDESLARILSLKLRLYGGAFRRSSVLVNVQRAGELEPQQAAVARMARAGITLLSPGALELATVLPNPPTKDESIVFITDSRTLRECPTCEPYPAVPRTALEEIALDLYGPRTTGQVDPTRVASFTFSDLVEYNRRVSAAAPTPGAVPLLPTATGPAVGEVVQPTATPDRPPSRIQAAIERASWIIIALIDTNPSLSLTAALRTFLSQSTDALKDKRVIIFALGAPYYLDATEISKATAYFGVYSRTRLYLEAALRAVFGEFAPQGASPVSVPGLSYSLINQTSPDRNQVIPLTPVIAGEVLTATNTTPTPLGLKIGDRLNVRAGPIFDLNGKVVPDGTEVQFILSYPAERLEQRPPEYRVTTRDGLAEVSILLERQGRLEIRAEADPARNSDRINVDATDRVVVETVITTAIPTEPSVVAAATERPELAAPAEESAPTVGPTLGPPVERSSIVGFTLTLLGLLGVSVGMFVALSQPAFAGVGLHLRVRFALGVWMIGWLIYTLVALGAPGTDWASRNWNWAGSVLLALVVALGGAGLGLLMLRFWGKGRERQRA